MCKFRLCVVWDKIFTLLWSGHEFNVQPILCWNLVIECDMEESLYLKVCPILKGWNALLFPNMSKNYILETHDDDL